MWGWGIDSPVRMMRSRAQMGDLQEGLAQQ
jgi:hypothetical protein